jgi:hypothetical protein
LKSDFLHYKGEAFVDSNETSAVSKVVLVEKWFLKKLPLRQNYR